MKLMDALRQDDRLTENGMATNSTSLSAVVDLFYNIGAMRGQNKDRLLSDFSKAFYQDPTRAMKILFWARDVRGGAGERQIFKDILVYLANNHYEVVAKNLWLVPQFGRWDDLLALEGTKCEAYAFGIIREALTGPTRNALCAKWMPRQGKTAAKLRNFMGLSPKRYRQLLVNLTRVVEQQMCAKEWDAIEFSQVPSVAAARYQRAFMKNANESYTKYLESLKKGETKINASSVYPYDVIKSLQFGNEEVATEQWNALPNYLDGANDMILPMVDVSGSMSCAAGNNANVTCLNVAISLGMYIAERNEGPFKDAFLTFSGEPKLEVLSGDLKDRYRQMSSSDWGMNTNLEAAFDLVLDQAKKHNVSQDQMPDKLLILSDMQFDEATASRRWMGESAVTEWNPTAQQMIETKYRDAGYKMPKIVYWNIQSRRGDVPVAFDKTGTALISGFSPAIMTSVLTAEEFNPVSIMDETILSDRYVDVKA
jgi:hypothetical protein